MSGGAFEKLFLFVLILGLRLCSSLHSHRFINYSSGGDFPSENKNSKTGAKHMSRVFLG